MWRSLDPEICTTGKQFVVALAKRDEAVEEPRTGNRQAHTGLAAVRNPAAAAAWMASLSWRKPM